MAFTIIFLLMMMMQRIPLDGFSFLIAKLFGYCFAVFAHFYFAKYQYNYFRNTGFRLRSILSGALFSDLIVYLLITSLCLR